MIESYFWRQELRREVAWLRRHQRFRRWTEKQQVLFERQMILVAFQIRVLLERPKVGARARRTKVSGRLYPKIGSESVNISNAVAIEDHFDLERPQSIQLSIREVCNQLIHHYVLFAIRGARQCFELVVVFSDYKRNACCYEFAVDDLLRAFALVASEESAASRLAIRWDEKRQDYLWDSFD